MKLLVFCALVGVCMGATAHRDPKVLGLFNVVRFKNDPCASTASISSSTTGASQRVGSCLSSAECSDKSGTAAGSCASGFGVCCVFTVDGCSSTGTVTQNNTFLRNEGFPTGIKTGPTTCMLTLGKASSDICMLRLDFETFDIKGVTTEGTPCTDKLTITGLSTGQTVPEICGLNTGHHIYLDLGTVAPDTAMAAFTFEAADTTTTRTWDIRVSQIECSSPYRPPSGCLQYLTGVSGSLKTFNFDNDQVHLDNQNYRICLRREEGYCCVRYTVPTSVINAFRLSPAEATFAQGTQDTACTQDYVVIDGSSSTGDIAQTTFSRYCGGAFNNIALAAISIVDAPIRTCTSFQVGIVTDGLIDDPVSTDLTRTSRGLQLDYVQELC